MQPQVTIILPVYNVEPYLRECLDSVVNQTMRDIQIICVNDGSTDGSRAILQEYADRDSRIEIIDQENQGAGSARNAAYPYILGKYIYFVDPDDWIELDLCQLCWDRAEETEADFVVLRFIPQGIKWCSPPFDSSLPEIRRTPEEKHEIIYMDATCMRFWRSEFLLSNNIKFSEGKGAYEDNIPAWKGSVLAHRIAILDSQPYHYRMRQEAAQQTIDEKHFFIVEVYNDIGNMLQESGTYEIYKDYYYERKLLRFYNILGMFPHSLQTKFLRHLRQYWMKEDQEYCQNTLLLHLDKNVRHFYLSNGFGGSLGMQKYHSELLSEILNILKENNRTTRFHYNKYRLLSIITWGKLREKYNAKRKAAKKALGIK